MLKHSYPPDIRSSTLSAFGQFTFSFVNSHCGKPTFPKLFSSERRLNGTDQSAKKKKKIGFAIHTEVLDAAIVLDQLCGTSKKRQYCGLQP